MNSIIGGEDRHIVVYLTMLSFATYAFAIALWYLIALLPNYYLRIILSATLIINVFPVFGMKGVPTLIPLYLFIFIFNH
jgi:hypothetical protein